MNNLWKMSIEDYIEVMEEAIILAKERGKKTGESIETEFFEIAKKKNKLPEHLGATELNKEELKEQYRIAGKEILDLTKKEK
jgi:20S proteasome alpha/beta subunit